MRKLPLVLISLLAFACDREPAAPPSAPSGVPPHPLQKEAGTPLQDRMRQWLASRADSGLPVPQVSFEFKAPQGISLSALKVKPGERYSYAATTVIHYSGPAEAGLPRWRDLTLSPAAARTLQVDPSALKQGYVARAEASFPGFWNRHQLGLEPRTITIREKGEILPPLASLVAPADASTTAATSGQLLLGFSLDVLYWTKSTGFDLEVCDVFGDCATIESVDFSVSVGVGLGLRLPIAGELESPQPLLEGSSYSGSASVSGADWSATQYSDAGVAPHDGHEFYADLYLHGCIALSGAVDHDDCAGPGINEHRDFATPFGPGASFQLPTIPVSIADFGWAGIDFTLTPNVGSDKITADWSVSGDAQGTGGLQFTNPASPVSLSPVLAVDGPGTAHYSVHGFRYYFNQFSVTLGLDPWIDIDIWSDDWPVDIVTIDLSYLVGALDLSVGSHPGSSPTSLAIDASILNVAPTAALAISGGQVVNFNGSPTIMANVGDVFTLTGTAHDPGRDDLTLSWDWGDGLPSPDESAFFPVPGATGPNNPTDVRTHGFGRACLYDVTFMAVDDDAASGEDHASILVTTTGNASRLEGYWQHQLGRNGGDLLDVSTINCYLAMTGLVSTVFNEARDASSVAAAFAVVNVAKNSGSALEQFDRELLVTWLNFAGGAIGYSQMVDTNEDGIPDTPFNQFMGIAEAVRLNPASTPSVLKAYTVILHEISEQFTKGFVG